MRATLLPHFPALPSVSSVVVLVPESCQPERAWYNSAQYARLGECRGGQGVRVAAHDMIRRAGEILKHAFGVLLLVWRRVLYATGIGGAVAFLLAEAAGCLVSHSFPPPLLTHAVALLFAFAVAWGAAVTMFIEELLTGLLDTTHFLEGHVEAGARAAAIIAEREAGEAGRGLSRLLGHRPRRQRPPVRIAATS